jgi:hypothetical protein
MLFTTHSALFPYFPFAGLPLMGKGKGKGKAVPLQAWTCP